MDRIQAKAAQFGTRPARGSRLRGVTALLLAVALGCMWCDAASARELGRARVAFGNAGSLKVGRASMGDRVRLLDAKRDDVRNQRDSYRDRFRAADEKSNQTMSRLASVVKTMQQMRRSRSAGF